MAYFENCYGEQIFARPAVKTLGSTNTENDSKNTDSVDDSSIMTTQNSTSSQDITASNVYSAYIVDNNTQENCIKKIDFDGVSKSKTDSWNYQTQEAHGEVVETTTKEDKDGNVTVTKTYEDGSYEVTTSQKESIFEMFFGSKNASTSKTSQMYDKDGNLIAEHEVTNDGEKTTTYTENGSYKVETVKNSKQESYVLYVDGNLADSSKEVQYFDKDGNEISESEYYKNGGDIDELLYSKREYEPDYPLYTLY